MDTSDQPSTYFSIPMEEDCTKLPIGLPEDEFLQPIPPVRVVVTTVRSCSGLQCACAICERACALR